MTTQRTYTIPVSVTVSGEFTPEAEAAIAQAVAAAPVCCLEGRIRDALEDHACEVHETVVLPPVLQVEVPI